MSNYPLAYVGIGSVTSLCPQGLAVSLWRVSTAAVTIQHAPESPGEPDASADVRSSSLECPGEAEANASAP